MSSICTGQLFTLFSRREIKYTFRYIYSVEDKGIYNRYMIKTCDCLLFNSHMFGYELSLMLTDRTLHSFMLLYIRRSTSKNVSISSFLFGTCLHQYYRSDELSFARHGVALFIGRREYYQYYKLDSIATEIEL